MRLTIWERLHILLVQYIFVPLFCIWMGRYFHRIRTQGEFGRKSCYEH
jgi:hypothetical protein